MREAALQPAPFIHEEADQIITASEATRCEKPDLPDSIKEIETPIKVSKSAHRAILVIVECLRWVAVTAATFTTLDYLKLSISVLNRHPNGGERFR